MAVLLGSRLLHDVETRARKKTYSVALRPHREAIRTKQKIRVEDMSTRAESAASDAMKCLSCWNQDQGHLQVRMAKHP
jgi:hypothetical protein